MATCKGCGRAIRFIRSAATGANVPLEEVAYYSLDQDLVEEEVAVPMAEKVWISHFLTCKRATDFSGRNR